MEEIKNIDVDHSNAEAGQTATAVNVAPPTDSGVSTTKQLDAAPVPTPAPTTTDYVQSQSLQTPPATQPKEELGTSGPKKPRQPRKPVAPKKYSTKVDSEEVKQPTLSVVGQSEDKVNELEREELIDTSSVRPSELGQRIRGDDDSQQQIIREPVDTVESRLTQARTTNGASYLLGASIFGRNAAAKTAYERVRERMQDRAGGWSRGRFK